MKITATINKRNRKKYFDNKSYDNNNNTNSYNDDLYQQ